MKAFVRAATVAVLGISALSGCGVLDKATGNDAAAATPAPTTPVEETSAAATTGLGSSVKDDGDIPDPCTLLTDAEVKDLTGREITQKNDDGEPAGHSTRYCQWQQDSGQLDIFLSRTAESDFKITIADASPVDGVGEDAFSLAGHLYVLYGTVSIDVYSRGDSDEQNLEKEKEIAKVLIPKI